MFLSATGPGFVTLQQDKYLDVYAVDYCDKCHLRQTNILIRKPNKMEEMAQTLKNNAFI